MAVSRSSMPPRPFLPPPEPGEVLWCRFPEVEGIKPGPKPRPCIVLWVSDPPTPGEVAAYRIRVVYGTTKIRGRALPHEADIDPNSNPAAFKAAGLSYPTRFNFKKAVVLNYDDMFFERAPQGEGIAPRPSPKIGILHPSLMRAFAAANAAVQQGGAKPKS